MCVLVLGGGREVGRREGQVQSNSSGGLLEPEHKPILPQNLAGLQQHRWRDRCDGSVAEVHVWGAPLELSGDQEGS